MPDTATSCNFYYVCTTARQDKTTDTTESWFEPDLSPTHVYWRVAPPSPPSILSPSFYSFKSNLVQP